MATSSSLLTLLKTFPPRKRVVTPSGRTAARDEVKKSSSPSPSPLKAPESLTPLRGTKPPTLKRTTPSSKFHSIDVRSLIADMSKAPVTFDGEIVDDDVSGSACRMPGMMMLKHLMGEQILQLTTTNETKVVTTAGGLVNSTILCSGITSSTEWGSINQLFDEFFILKMYVRYFPVSKYQYLTSSPPSTSLTNVPFVSVSLFHGNSAYSASLAGPAENATHKFGNTMENHTHTWVNNENWRSGAVAAATTSVATPSQGWCNIAATPAGAYQGFVQFCSSDALSASSFQIGRFVISYETLYRSRS